MTSDFDVCGVDLDMQTSFLNDALLPQYEEEEIKTLVN